MGFFDIIEDIADDICDAISIEDIADDICDVIGDAISDGFDYVRENPIKSLAIAATGVASGGLAYIAAGPIASTVGALGLLGSASTGAEIAALSGAALESASLAAFGGGAVAAGGGGMAAGTAVIGAGGAALGVGASGGLAASTRQ